MDDLMKVKMLNDDVELFDKEFRNLKEFYIFENEKEIHDFIKIHPGIILLLNEFEPSLKKYFPTEFFKIKFGPDPSGTWFDLLVLDIWMDKNRFFNGSTDDIRKIRRQFLPLRRKLDLLGEVLILKRIIRD